MSKPYKLTYFDMRGLAEQIRLLLVDNQIPFEEKRFTKDEDSEWQKLKAKLPLGQLPLLQDDDETIAQSGAIMRHLARKHGLYGRGESEHTYADMVFDSIKDWHSIYAKTVYCGDQNFQELRANYLSQVLPKILSAFTTLLQRYDNGEHFLLGTKISFVDYALFEELDCHLRLDGGCLEKYPLLAAFHSRINQRPSLQNHLMKRATSHVPINWSGNAN